MNIPDNMDELLGADEAQTLLEDVAKDDIAELVLIWTTRDGEDIDIHYAANGLRQSRMNWLLDSVKRALFSGEHA